MRQRQQPVQGVGVVPALTPLETELPSTSEQAVARVFALWLAESIATSEGILLLQPSVATKTGALGCGWMCC
jgi:hypothetical protein